MRKLVTVREISNIFPIENADAIEVAQVDDWKVIVRKSDGFKPGSKGVYFEIDSVLPITPEYVERGLSRNSYVRNDWLPLPNGEGFRLRTVHIRGTLSQGFLLPYNGQEEVGYDLTSELGVVKWDPPEPVHLRGKARGNFPDWAVKSEEKRIQNIFNTVKPFIDNRTLFEVSMKLHGTSMTVCIKDGVFHICSRNNSLQLTQTGNAYVDLANKLDLETKISSLGRNLSFGGELCGPGICGNNEKLKEHHWYVFNIFDVDKQTFLTSKERLQICQDLNIEHVPVWGVQALPKTVAEILAMAEGPSLNSEIREGTVFKSLDGSFSFKTVSNVWLTKYRE